MPGTASAGAAGYWTSIGHGSGATAPKLSLTDVPFSERWLVASTRPTAAWFGSAPGCHVAVATPVTVVTAPACPACAIVFSTAGAGTGAARIVAVGFAVAEPAPPLPIAVTVSEITEPMSPGEVVYVTPPAPAIATHAVAPVAQRRHW